MKQPNFIQTKLNYLGRTTRYVQVDAKSIDVDKVKVYEINDENVSKKAIDIDPVHLEIHFEQQNPTQSPFKETIKSELSKKVIFDTNNCPIQEHPNQMNISIKTTKKHKLSPFESHIHKVHKIINHFLSINESNTTLKISSQNFYNLCQSRKKLFLTNLATSKDFFETQYTNYMSFLHLLIQSKQRNYEIYEEFEQFEKIINILQSQIQDLTERYIKDQQSKIFEIFSEQFTQDIENLSQKCDQLHKQTRKTPILQMKSSSKIIIQENNQQSPVEEGQMNIKQFSNKSFNHQSREFLQKAPISVEFFQKSEKIVQIELKEVKILNQSSNSQKSINLFSSLEEREIYTIGKNQILIENGSNSQKHLTFPINMEIEEEK